MDLFEDKALGCLVGGAAGDALGYTVEFLSLRDIQRRFGPEGIRDYVVDTRSGNALVSDDTQMTLFHRRRVAYGSHARSHARHHGANERLCELCLSRLAAHADTHL